jgi:glutathione S-transferase
MITLYHAPLSRSLRIVWLLEELALPYQLERMEFVPPERPFGQRTPTGKFPTLVDGDVTIFESGAIVEYVLERHGGGRLAPAPGTPSRGPYLQWVHFAEATAFPPLGNLAWHRMRRNDAESMPTAIADYTSWAEASLDALEHALDGREFLLPEGFSGADVMMGYTLWVARAFRILDDRHPAMDAYLTRLLARPAFQKAFQL